MSETIGLAGDRIRSFVERIEQIERELAELAKGKKEVFAEAKNEGFDVYMRAMDDVAPMEKAA